MCVIRKRSMIFTKSLNPVSDGFSGIQECTDLRYLSWSSKHIEYNKDYPYFEAGEAEKYIASTSIRERRIADPGVCSSDLCYSAAERLIEDLGWDKSEIECLLFVSQTADYILPATACILQERLGLPRVATPWIYPWAALVGFMV